MNNAPAFQHYVGDFLSHPIVALMTAQEVGAYWLLVNYEWKSGELPNDVEELAIYARLPVETFEPMWTRRISRCFQLTGRNTWIHPFLESERLKHDVIREARQNASASRWNKQKKVPPNANAMQMESSSSSTSSATSKKEKDETNVSSKKMKNGSRIPDDFYPSDEMVKWAKETVPDINLDARITEFKNYWESKTGKDATKMDWDKTFQNRILQIAEYQTNRNGVKQNGASHNGNGNFNGKASKTGNNNRGYNSESAEDALARLRPRLKTPTKI